MLSSTTAVYSSGPVTPSMWNRPCRSWWPSERHSRAVSTSSSSPTSRSKSLVAGGLHVAARPRRRCRRRCGRRRCRPASTPSTPGPRMVRHGNAAPCSPSVCARSRARSRVECRQRSTSRAAAGLGVGQHRQHERLGVPERVAVVAGAGQALGGDRPLLGPGARPAARGTGRTGPPAAPRGRPRPRTSAASQNVVQVLALLPRRRPVPAGQPGARPARRRPGRAARAASGRLDQPYAKRLDHPQLCPGSSTQATVVRSPVRRCALGGRPRCLPGAVDQVLHRRRPSAARWPWCGAPSRPPVVAARALLGLQRRLQHGRDPRVAGSASAALVGDQLGLQDQPGRPRRAARPRSGSRRPTAG